MVNTQYVRGQMVKAPKLFSTLRKNAGFTITEILVGVGIMAILAGLFASSVLDLKTSVSEFTDKNDGLLFVNSLTTSLLGSQGKCSSFISGKNLPPPGGAPIAFSINGYQGYGGNGGTIATGSIITGTPANIGLRIKNLTISAKNISDTNVTSNGVNYIRRVAVLTIALERRTRNAANTFVDLPVRYIEFPVYVTPANQMTSCQLEMQPNDVCQMIGSTFTGTACKPEVQCQLKGTYITSQCTPAYGGCPASVVNPVTGAATCPVGSTATQTGEATGNFNVDCGKKCSYNVTNAIRFYICMQCN